MKMYRRFSRFSVIMPIQYQLQPEKAVEAAAMFLKLHGKPMPYLGLLKLLYMADRIALERMEQPITGDCYVSMKFGPVLSGVYDLIKGKNVGQALPIWSQFISSSPKNYSVNLADDPGNDELCEAEEEIITEVYKSCGNYNCFKLAELTHYFPEWKDPNPVSKSAPLPVESILKSVGKSDSEIKEIELEVAAERYLDGVLNE
jgi:uncharacterized phage-associated protein